MILSPKSTGVSEREKWEGGEQESLLLHHSKALSLSLAAIWMETSSLRSRGSFPPSSICSLCK